MLFGWKVSLPEGVTPTPLKVAALIEQENREWRSDIIDEMVKDEDAEVIKNIRLSRNVIQEKLIWRFSNNEIFNVKSAYHVPLVEDSVASQSHAKDQILYLVFDSWFYSSMFRAHEKGFPDDQCLSSLRGSPRIIISYFL